MISKCGLLEISLDIFALLFLQPLPLFVCEHSLWMQIKDSLIKRAPEMLAWHNQCALRASLVPYLVLGGISDNRAFN